MEFYAKEVVLSSKRAAAKFAEFRQNLKFCDVTLQSGHVVVKAHRALLVAASPYFEAIMNEGLQDSNKLVDCSDIPADALPSVVDFLYTGRVTIESSTAQDLMVAAHMLCLDGLVTGCARYLKTQLNTSNALSLLSLAESLRCSKLSGYALDYIGEHWTIIVQRKEFLEMSLTIFIKILSSDGFVTDKELEVVFAVVRWLEHAPAARAPHCSELVCHLRLGCVPAHILDEIWRIVKDKRVAEGLHLSKKKTAAMANTRVRNRGVFYMVGYKGILKYDIYKKVWENLVAVDAFRNQPGFAALDGRLYMVGGHDDENRLRSGEAYDPVTNKWSPIANMNEARTEFALASLHGKLYAFGGYGVDGELLSIEVYDPKTDQWTWAGDLPEPMAEVSAVTYNDAVYLIYHESLLCYCPSVWPQGEWHSCAERSLMRTECSAAVFGDQLYIVGGYNDEHIPIDIVERYNFFTDRWEVAKPMSVAVKDCAASAVGDVLFVFSPGWLQMYDADEDRWTLDTNTPPVYSIRGCFGVLS